jgi:hypothetical protein
MVSSLDALGVNLVVLPVSANEPDVDHAVWVVNPGDKPVSVASDVEDNSAIPKDTCRVEIGFHLCGGLPSGVLDLLVPGQKGLLGIRVASPEGLEGGEGDQPHKRI